ncbi:MAG: hypothetical protein HY706_12735, partial [Candidatus Hydrogenedentes bacterium]|nr:hypothetical protein [Candidatus Hydrogenedentota bacterium]
DGSQPGDRNYDFLLSLWNRPGSTGSRQGYLPYRTDIRDIHCAVLFPGMQFRLANVSFRSRVFHTARYAADLTGNNVSGAWQPGPSAPLQPFDNGRIRLSVTRNSDGLFFEAAPILIPELAEVESSIGVTWLRRVPTLDAEIHKAVLANFDLSGLPDPYNRVPVRFTRADLSGTRLRANFGMGRVSVRSSSLNADLRGLVVGPDGNEYFAGDVGVHGSLAEETVEPQESTMDSADTPPQLPAIRGDFDILVNDSVKLHAGVSGQVWQPTLAVQFADWSREDLGAVLPGFLRPALDSSALDPSLEAMSASGTVISRIGNRPNIEGTFDLVRLGAARDGALKLEVAGFGAARHSMFPLDISGAVIPLPEGNFGQLKYGLTFNEASSDFRGTLTVSDLDLGAASSTFYDVGLPEGVLGRMSGKVDLEHAAARSQAQFDLSAPVSFAALRDLPVRFEGTASHETGASAIRLAGLVAHSGSATRVRCENLEVPLPLSRLVLPLHLESDLQPLVAAGLLQSVTGNLAGAGAVYYDRPGWRTTWDINSNSESAVLAGGIGAVNAAQLQGRLLYDSAISGEGRANLGGLTAIGATFREVAAPLTWKEERLHSEAEARLFGGTVQAQVEVGPLDPELPITLTATLTKLNLETFTREYQPPATSLTGVTDGEVSLVWNRNGLQDLRVKFVSTEQFSINANLLQTLLLSKYVKQVSHGEKLDKIIAKVIGGEEQRAFDRAELTLRLEDGGLNGTVVLRSKAFNLTIDLIMTPRALAEALRLQQEARLEQIAGIRMQPAQSGE